MNTLVVLDSIQNRVLFIRLTDGEYEILQEEYENDAESWLAELGLEKKFGFSISNSNWMLVEGEPELFRCNPQNGEMVEAHTFL